MCPHTAMYVCRYGIALYTHGRTQPSGRGSNLVHMYHTARADTGEGFTGQTRDTKSGGGGGGGEGGCTLQTLYPPLYGILTQW